MLRAEHLQMSFGALAVTKNVSLNVPLGMRHAIIGPNGAGKTTLFNLLSGDLSPISGNIYIGDVDVTKRSIDQRARLGLSRSFQKNNLFENETVAENFLLADIARQGYGYRFWPRLASMRDAFEHAEATAALVGLSDDFERPVQALSYGARRQLEVGLALMTKPKILLLDEPTSGMSPEETQCMLALIEGLPRNLAVVIIEHDMDLVFAYADRITVLNYGEILMEGTPDEVRGSAVVQETYLGGDLA